MDTKTPEYREGLSDGFVAKLDGKPARYVHNAAKGRYEHTTGRFSFNQDYAAGYVAGYTKGMQ